MEIAELDARPRLRHCTMLDDGEGPLRLIVGNEHFELTEIVGSREIFYSVKCKLDGRHTVSDIAKFSGLSIDEVSAVVKLFADLGLLRREKVEEHIKISAFADRLEQTLTMWRRQIGYHPLFQKLSKGEVRREVLVGLVIETYHVVRLASHHIGVALAHAQDQDLRNILSHYLCDEHSHAPLILDTACALGVSRDHVVNAHPLIGTMSLVNMLCEIARSDTIAYIAATKLFEAVPQELSDAKRSISSISEAYNIDVSVFDSMLSHTMEDMSASHADLLKVTLERKNKISCERAHTIVNHLHDLKHSYDQHHDQILQYYSDVSNYIPRLKVDYFSL